jgi:hypothetical protein
MPQLFSSKTEIPIASMVGRILYPFGVSFLLPIFVITLVKEKEDRILVMMRMVSFRTFSRYHSLQLNTASDDDEEEKNRILTPQLLLTMLK